MSDLTRTNELGQKKGICVFAGVISEGTDNGQVAAANGDHLLGNLPPNSLITGAYIFTKKVSDAATSLTGKLGTTSGGSQILSASNLKTLGKGGTFTGHSDTDTGKPIYLGLTYVGAATAVGEYLVVVEYIEYTKNTGEYTLV